MLHETKKPMERSAVQAWYTLTCTLFKPLTPVGIRPGYHVGLCV